MHGNRIDTAQIKKLQRFGTININYMTARQEWRKKMVARAGTEPATRGFSGAAKSTFTTWLK
jgi:hypothetical protein